MIPLQTVNISTHNKINSPYSSGSTKCYGFFNLKGAIGESVPVGKPKSIAEAAAENEALSRAIEEDFALLVALIIPCSSTLTMEIPQKTLLRPSGHSDFSFLCQISIFSDPSTSS